MEGVARYSPDTVLGGLVEQTASLSEAGEESSPQPEQKSGDGGVFGRGPGSLIFCGLNAVGGYIGYIDIFCYVSGERSAFSRGKNVDSGNSFFGIESAA